MEARMQLAEMENKLKTIEAQGEIDLDVARANQTFYPLVFKYSGRTLPFCSHATPLVLHICYTSFTVKKT